MSAAKAAATTYRIEWNFQPSPTGGKWRSKEWSVHTPLPGAKAKEAKAAYRKLVSVFEVGVRDCFRLVRIRRSESGAVVVPVSA